MDRPRIYEIDFLIRDSSVVHSELSMGLVSYIQENKNKFKIAFFEQRYYRSFSPQIHPGRFCFRFDYDSLAFLNTFVTAQCEIFKVARLQNVSYDGIVALIQKVLKEFEAIPEKRDNLTHDETFYDRVFEDLKQTFGPDQLRSSEEQLGQIILQIITWHHDRLHKYEAVQVYAQREGLI